MIGGLQGTKGSEASQAFPAGIEAYPAASAEGIITGKLVLRPYHIISTVHGKGIFLSEVVSSSFSSGSSSITVTLLLSYMRSNDRDQLKTPYSV